MGASRDNEGEEGLMKDYWKPVGGSDSAPKWTVMALETFDAYSDDGPIEALKALFPAGEADGMNFCLFSTSGISGSYCPLERVERSAAKYGFESWSWGDEDAPDDWESPWVTFIVVQPRIWGLRGGNVRIESLEDLNWLKRLRQSSWDAVLTIGREARPEEDEAVQAVHEAFAKLGEVERNIQRVRSVVNSLEEESSVNVTDETARREHEGAVRQALRSDLIKRYGILAFFAWDHLPNKLRDVSKPFAELAWAMAERETSHPAEVAAGLRKLLEAKDCAVRAAL